MIRFFFFILILLFLCTNSYTFELAELESETAEELLLFYDWEELLVEAPTRRPTRIKDVAENISIITAEEIAEMNAHSVNEILRTVTGVTIRFAEYYGGSGTTHIHISTFAHNLILLDGVRINEVNEGYTHTTGIPVQIIDRIEIIKGPASSAWGSALGGVINIITKSGKDDSRPTGTVYGSYGEKQSRDFRVDAGGGSGKLRYYLYAGKLETNGLVTALASSDLSPDRWHKSENVYAKVNFDPSKDVSLTFSAGYWRERHLNIIVPTADWQDPFGVDDYFVRGKLEATLSPDLKFNLNLYNFDNVATDHYTVVGTGLAGNAGDFYQEYVYDNPAYGGDISITWDKGRHSMLLGAEYYYGEFNASARYGSYRQSQGNPPQENLGEPEVTNTAVYFNDTISWDRFTITPGLRYDHLNISDILVKDMLNPSLGMIYKITEDTLLRATVARGFARPSLVGVTGWTGRVPLPGNPNLKSQTSWSYQAGIESAAIENMHLKADLFYHRIDKTWFYNTTINGWDNADITERKGYELNATAGPFHNLTTGLGFTYVRLNSPIAAYVNTTEPEYPYDDFYCLNTKLRYKDRRIGNITLFGQYLWFGKLASSQSREPRYDDMLWDLHYNKEIHTTEQTRTDFFFSVRNLFSGAHYWNNYFLNPDRWVEAGLRVKF
jgi:vitamin B12 transporter